MSLITMQDVRMAAVVAVALGEHRDATTRRIRFPGELSGDSPIIPPERMRLRIEWLRAVLRIEAVVIDRAQLNILRRGYTRASGHCVCPSCGLFYHRHPPDVADEPDMFPSDSLTILCDGTRVKL